MRRRRRDPYTVPMPIDDGYVLEAIIYEGKPYAVPVPNRYREIRCKFNMDMPLTMEEAEFHNNVMRQVELIVMNDQYCKCSLCKL